MMHKFNKPKTTRLGVFHRNKRDWAICLYKKSWGINKNNVLYSSEKIRVKVTFSKGKLWTRWGNGTVKSFQTKDVHHFNEINGAHKLVREEIIKRLPFMENFFNHGNDITFGTIRNKKLYNLNRIIRHLYNIPLSKYKSLMSECEVAEVGDNEIQHDLTALRKYSQIFTHCENVRLGNLTSAIWNDTMKFAGVLGKKINCGWSLKRLNAEHNKWYQEINEVLYKGDLSPLTIADRFQRFADYSGYTLLASADKLYAEGLINNHCVATYVPKVNSGDCAIFHYKGGTLELSADYQVSGGVRKSQFMDRGNTTVPRSIVNEVVDMIGEYNKMLEDEINSGVPSTIEERAKAHNVTEINIGDLLMDDLPF